MSPLVQSDPTHLDTVWVVAPLHISPQALVPNSFEDYTSVVSRPYDTTLFTWQYPFF